MCFNRIKFGNLFLTTWFKTNPNENNKFNFLKVFHCKFIDDCTRLLQE